jgi:hypothetical protein
LDWRDPLDPRRAIVSHPDGEFNVVWTNDSKLMLAAVAPNAGGSAAALCNWVLAGG